MPQLVAIDMPAGNQFLAAVLAVWGRGDAIFPIDRRLPPQAQMAVIAAMAPASIIDSKGDESALPESRPMRGGDALVIATSGSTGEPKGVVHTHGSIQAAAIASNTRLACDKSHHWLVCLPVSHVGGFSVITRALQAESGLTLHPTFDTQRVVSAAEHGATHVSLVPTTLSRIDPSKFQKVLLGGARAPENLAPNVVTTYGMTETFGGAFYDNVALDGVEYKIVDGQVFLRGPMLMRAYRDESTPLTQDGWLPTGDSGTLTEGRLQVNGRMSDMIITGGENVWPNSVERVIDQHPNISESAVAGVADDEWGERVVAWIVLNETFSAPSLSEIREIVAQSLPAYCCPKEIRVIKQLPTTSLGKVDRKLLPLVG